MSALPDYPSFLSAKAQYGSDSGFSPVWMPDFLFDFQKALVEWAVRKGRGALFADCGLGKTPMQLVWAENVVRKTNRPVLILTPLAVAARDVEDEKHVHPLQLDVIERIVTLWSNPGETVLTPFMGVGSEVYGAVRNGRRGLGIELKASYYRQACRNVAAAATVRAEAQDLLEIPEEEPDEEAAG